MKLSDIAVRALKAPSLKDFVVSLLPGQRNDGLTSISRAGVSINEANALSQITVFACVRVISETLASLPLMLYRRLPRGKERAIDHELYRILHDQPNPEMDSMTLRETLMAHVLTWGNGYAQIIWDDYTHIKELRPLYPDRMWVTRDPVTKQVLYNYSPSGGGGPGPDASGGHRPRPDRRRSASA